MALCVAVAGCSAPPPSVSAPISDLRWGGDAEGGAPFVEADPADPSKVRGFDVDIAGLIAAGLGAKARFVQVAWASIPASVERGDFAIGMSGIEDRPELRAQHSVSIPYFEFREVLAVRPGDRDRFRTLADLAGRRIGTLGSTQAYEILLAESARSKVVPVSYDDDVHPYADLVAGRVDAVLLDHIIAERSLHRSGGFVIQPVPVATGHYVAVIAKTRTAFRDSVNAVLLARIRDGSLEKVLRTWNIWDTAQARYLSRVATEAPPNAARDCGGLGHRAIGHRIRARTASRRGDHPCALRSVDVSRRCHRHRHRRGTCIWTSDRPRAR